MDAARGKSDGNSCRFRTGDSPAQAAGRGPWQEAPAVGEGHEFRAEPGLETHASALTFSSTLLHGIAVVDAAT